MSAVVFTQIAWLIMEHDWNAAQMIDFDSQERANRGTLSLDMTSSMTHSY